MLLLWASFFWQIHFFDTFTAVVSASQHEQLLQSMYNATTASYSSICYGKLLLIFHFYIFTSLSKLSMLTLYCHLFFLHHKLSSCKWWLAQLCLYTISFVNTFHDTNVSNVGSKLIHHVSRRNVVVDPSISMILYYLAFSYDVSDDDFDD